MSALDDLIKKIPDENLRKLIDAEFRKLLATKKFGLVFEEQKPEVTPLYDIPIKKNSLVAKKIAKLNDVFKVLEIAGENVTCAKVPPTEEIFNFNLNELVSVAMFGEPIYPYLQKLDEISNAPDSDLWHILIEADNYHALQLLQYVCADRKVDCIYIDPPYNTGAKDWKYNNDYVDGADVYRHSKWLSMMQKRLLLAKKILNPDDSVLIVTIDEKEYLHLGCLLEEIFPEAEIQMISSLTSRSGAARFNSFTRVNEFIFFVMIGNYNIIPFEDADYSKEGQSIHWRSFRRGNPTNIRNSRPSQFYPIYVNKENNRIVKIGDPITPDIDRFSVEKLPNCETVFPVRDDGTEMLWGVTPDSCRKLLENGYIKATKYTADKPQQYVILYLSTGTIKDIENGKVNFKGYTEDGGIIADNLVSRKMMPRTLWTFDSHDARDYGTKILNSIIGNRFSFPKSLYAVRDCLKFFVANKKDALIVDFFAGSGTTMHAVNLLNAEDGGRRRCILVTNNEVSESEEKNLTRAGFQPNDEEWQKMGVARYVTWARTVCSITGKNIHGEPLSGNYLGSEIPMADGFKSNAAFFKLGFLNKNAVALGRQFQEILPLLWLKSGGFGRCPSLCEENYLKQSEGGLSWIFSAKKSINFLILPENKFAVLIDEKYFGEFEEKVLTLPEIETIFIVTDSKDGYIAMIQNLRDRKTYQLYQDYLENFTINS